MMNFNNIATTSPQAQQAFDTVQKVFGGVPNLMKKFANAPEAMEHFTKFYQTLGQGELTPALIEQIALTVSAFNQCEYCVAVHVMMGQHYGLERDEMLRNIEGKSANEKTQAILDYAKELLVNHGQVNPKTLSSLSSYDINEKMTIEILCIVNVFTLLNSLKHLTQPELDFPPVKEFTPNHIFLEEQA